MKITLEQVDYVAVLGRLALDEEEKLLFQGQLENILEYMDKLSEVSTDEVEPMAGPVELYTPLRDDVIFPSLSIEAALANAPDTKESAFRVPKIIE
jgi:aspartyl-tRNA(Asn)/glutamyl-tRNA(Gln) amidotransferase subunit C